MKIVVIGNGSIGMRHANNLLRMKHDVLVIDSDPAKTTAKALINKLKGHDAAIICVPTTQHLSVLEKCISEGLPTYIEKPLGHYTQMTQWQKLSQRKDLPIIMVGYQLRFHQDIQQCIKTHGKNSISSGQLKIFCNMSRWKGQSAKGNFLLEMSHEIDLAMYLGAGALTSSVSDAKHRYAFMSFEDGWSVELCGSSRSYNRSWTLRSGVMAVTHEYQDSESLGNKMYEDSMLHFISAVKNKRRITKGCTLLQAIDVMKVIQEVSDAQ